MLTKIISYFDDIAFLTITYVFILGKLLISSNLQSIKDKLNLFFDYDKAR